MDRIDFIAFDIGGVLFNFNHATAWERTLPHCAISEETAYERFYNSGDMIESMIGQLDDTSFFSNLTQKLEFQGTAETIRDIWENTIEPIPHRIAQALALSKTHRLGIISNISPFHSNKVDAHPDFIQHFERVTYSWKAGYVKPRFEIFDACLEGLGLYSCNCLFIDDQERQTDAAAELGWQTLHLTPDQDLESRLKEFRIQLPTSS